MKKIVFIIAVASGLLACKGQDDRATDLAAVQKTKAQWEKEMTPEQYDVMINKGTERPFSGPYWNLFEKGTYICAACGNPLFNSDSKFVSDCGWPSFDEALDEAVVYNSDTTLGEKRTEVLCAKCGGHLGHLFDDGPLDSTGKRFCMNSVSINFVPSN